MAVAFAKRRFRLEIFRIDIAFDNNLRFCRHHEINRLCFDHIDRVADQPTGHRHLIYPKLEFLWRAVTDTRRTAENDCHRHLLAAFLILQPVLMAFGTTGAHRHPHRHAGRAFQPGAIGAHVLHAGLGIAADTAGRREVRCAVKTRGRDRNRQAIEPLTLTFEIRVNHDFMTGSVGHLARRNRVGDGMAPDLADILDRGADTNAVDRAIGRECTNGNRQVIFLPARAGDVVEDKRLAVGFGNATTELPAHQRMHFGILIDRLVDGLQQVRLIQRFQMILKIRIPLTVKRFWIVRHSYSP